MKRTAPSFNSLPLKILKWRHWEYWPAWLTNIPVVFFWLWFGLRARSLLFFTAVNPAIETGGVLGESKYNILKRIPEEFRPKMIFIPAGASAAEIRTLFGESQMTYPLIAKPDIGERGFLVTKIHDENELLNFLSSQQRDFILQAFVDYPNEASVLYHRFPDSRRGKITSLCLKKFLTIRGDGESCVADLMKRDLRASLQLPRFRKEKPGLLSRVPAAGEELLLEGVGNHCKGTTFLNGNRYINERLERVFDEVAMGMEGILYGRFDLRYRDMERLERGEDFAILEFNGIAGEPAHVYDPDMSVRSVYADIYRHWKIIYRLYLAQKARGVRPASWRETLRHIRRYLQS